MKRFSILSFMIVLFITMASSALSARVYMGLLGSYTDAGDAQELYGAGVDLGVDVTPGFIFFGRIIMNYPAIEDKGTDAEVKYKLNTFLACLQYRGHVMDELPLVYTVTLGVGSCLVSADPAKEGSKSTSDIGKPTYALWLGVDYVWTQTLCPYFQLGYHKSRFENDYKSSSVQGLQVIIGVRFTFFGDNRGISEDYM